VADYFVSPKDYSDLRVESSQLARALAERWPDVRVVERDDAANTLRWAVRMPEGRELWGELQGPGQVAALEGELVDAAEFARWLRRQIPGRYSLIFYDEGYAHDVPLTDSTSVEELVQPFLVQS
jgi:hypothetical protein